MRDIRGGEENIRGDEGDIRGGEGTSEEVRGY